MDMIKEPDFAEANTVFQAETSELKREGKAQTQTQASKPSKCRTSTSFHLEVWRKKVWIFLLNVVLFGDSVDVFVLKQLIIAENGIYQFCTFCAEF